jgi:predicted AAA+ superfamily ATPase
MVEKFIEIHLSLAKEVEKLPLFSGSSTINLLKAKGDLSRRAVFYNLRGLSFREYLILRLDKQFQPVELKDLSKEHIKLADKISSQLPVLKYFREYLKFGYYPFFKERNIFIPILSSFKKQVYLFCSIQYGFLVSFIKRRRCPRGHFCCKRLLSLET